MGKRGAEGLESGTLQLLEVKEGGRNQPRRAEKEKPTMREENQESGALEAEGRECINKGNVYWVKKIPEVNPVVKQPED